MNWMVKSCWKPLVFAPNSIASNLKMGSNRMQKCPKLGGKPFITSFLMMFCLEKEMFVRTWPKFNLNSINCLWLKETKLSWVSLTTNVSSWMTDFSPYGLHSLEQSMTFCTDILVALSFDLNVIDTCLSKLFRCPICTQWVDKNHGSTFGWRWIWNSLHNVIINITQSWFGRKCLCNLLHLQILQITVHPYALFTLHEFQKCFFFSFLRYNWSWLYTAMRWWKCWS